MAISFSRRKRKRLGELPLNISRFARVVSALLVGGGGSGLSGRAGAAQL